MASTSRSTHAEPGGPEYASFVVDRIAEDDERVSSLQARGVMIITTSGSLVTLLLGISAFARDADGAPPLISGELVAAAAVAFVAAAVAGLAVNMPRRVLLRPDVDHLERLIAERWHEPASGKDVAAVRVRQLRSMERSNDHIARVLLVGMASEVLAVGLTAAAVVILLLSR